MTLRIMQGFLACGFIAFARSITKVHPHIQFLLAVTSSSLTNHSR
jgi:hypothetical protein